MSRVPAYFVFGPNKGFTLVELMFVVSILSVLAAIAIPQFQSYAERARYAKAIQTIRMMERELQSFNIINGHYPESLAEVGMDTLRDPWGNPYQYLNILTAKGKGEMRKNYNLVPVNTDFDLYSMGPDGQSQPPFTAKTSRDDIVRAGDGAFIGRVSQY
jgi:general secretion pathway protein G